MAYKWMRVFIESDRTLMLGTRFSNDMGLELMYMVKVGGLAKTFLDQKAALNYFNEPFTQSLIQVAKHMPVNLSSLRKGK